MTKDDWEAVARLAERLRVMGSGDDYVTDENEDSWRDLFEERALSAIRAGDIPAMRALLVEPYFTRQDQQPHRARTPEG